MNREKAFQVIGELDDRFIAEAVCYAPEGTSASSGRTKHMKPKRIITLVLAAVLLLSLGAAAYGVRNAVGTPEAAERVARQEIEVWKDMGILSPEVEFEGNADRIYERQEHTGNEYWYGRLFPHSYDVGWYMGRMGTSEQRKYGCNLTVDTLTGKIVQADINAVADKDDVPVPGREIQMEISPDLEHPEKTELMTFHFYENYDDIFPADMTVDRFCTLLAEYWGFTGYTIADTVDESYDAHWEALDGSTLLKDLNADTRENYYMTVFFDGDQEGAPMYIELHQFPGYVTLTLGNGHAVG